MENMENAEKSLPFRSGYAAKFEAYVVLTALEKGTGTIKKYLSVGSTTLHRWSKYSPFQEEFDKQLEDVQSRIKPGSPEADEVLKKLQVDCGIRHLLRDKDVQFMHDFSVFLDTNTAATADSKGNGESTRGETAVRKDIQEAAETVDLDPDAFLQALLDRLQASDGKQ